MKIISVYLLATVGVLAIQFYIINCTANTPETRDALTQYAAKIEHCQELGRDAGSYRVYEDCTYEAGLR